MYNMNIYVYKYQILEWLDDEAVNEWLKKETIDTIDDYPKFRMTESKVFEKDIEINGLFLTNPFEYDEVLFKNNNFFFK